MRKRSTRIGGIGTDAPGELSGLRAPEENQRVSVKECEGLGSTFVCWSYAGGPVRRELGNSNLSSDA